MPTPGTMSLIIASVIILLCTVVVMVTALALFLALVGNVMTGVPFVPAPSAVLKELIELCPLTPLSVFYDLGCGDGRFVFAMARRYPDARCVGVEKAPLPSLLAYLRSRLSPTPNVHIRYGDFAQVPLADATHVFLYLFPALMDRLLPKLEAELKPGARVVSCDFTFSSRAPDRVIPLGPGTHPHRLYVYTF